MKETLKDVLGLVRDPIEIRSMSELSNAQSEDRSQATSFSLRLTEDRDVNVSSLSSHKV